MQTLVPILLAAVADAARTKEALDALATTDFVHALDPASLSLIVPVRCGRCGSLICVLTYARAHPRPCPQVVRRGLTDRATTVKAASAVIVGNMCGLVGEPGDLSPYLAAIIAALKKTLVDSIPEVRGVSAQALGSLLKGVGEDAAPDVMPWLIDTMQVDTSTVDRSGAAQGIAEVVVALGEPRLSETLATLLPLGSSPRAAAREGVLWLLVFLPAVMGASYASIISATLPIVLQGAHPLRRTRAHSPSHPRGCSHTRTRVQAWRMRWRWFVRSRCELGKWW